MKLKDRYKVREVAGEYMLLPTGVVDTKCVFSLSESSAWLWKSLGNKDFDENLAVSLIVGEYDIDEETARADVSGIIKLWREHGLLDE